MKKLIIVFTLLLSFLSANAQIATENSNALDNIAVGITAGVSTPLDFNSVFPLNTNVGIKVQKDFTPVLGAQLEGLAVLNDNHFADIKTLVKTTNIGLNGVVNLTNAFCGYNGTPRTFEVSAVAGLGWLRAWDIKDNSLTAKTGVDLALNLGRNKAHSIVLTPAIYWNLHKIDAIQFTKHGAQLALNLTYMYHFKTSNGTHHFKTYDIDAILNEISYLQGKLNECEKREPKVIEKIIEKTVVQPGKPVTNNAIARDRNTWVVTFVTGSSRLSIEDFFILNQIERGATVDIVATASPEGTAEFNKKLSEDRAKAVADHLSSRGVKINSAVGKGVDAVSGRSATVTVW
jgi:hypothetical protein